MVKKNSDEKLDKIVDELISDVDADRDRLTLFLDRLITEHHDQAAGIAEYVAKLIDASTRQHQVKASMIKSLTKKASDIDAELEAEKSDLADQIGMPFEDEVVDEGSN